MHVHVHTHTYKHKVVPHLFHIVEGKPIEGGDAEGGRIGRHGDILEKKLPNHATCMYKYATMNWTYIHIY